MLKVPNVRMPVGSDESLLRTACAKSIRLNPDVFTSFRILRKSLDIRDKSRLEYVYTVAVEFEGEERLLSKTRRQGLGKFSEEKFVEPTPGSELLRNPPIIVGAGPAGLFAALLLAQHGYKPILLERGKQVRERIEDVAAFDRGAPLDAESNYLFGEGGAGTFSDGKLTCRSSGPDVQRVLEIFAENKGKPEILYEAKPHLGSNRLPAVVKSLRRRIIELGGEIRFGWRMDDLICENGKVSAVQTPDGLLKSNVIILAIGHSARDTYRMLLGRGVPMEAKPFQMGLRIEQSQLMVTRQQYGPAPEAGLLGPADYTMNVHCGTHDLFTFCMCAGGFIMPSVSQHGFFCTNGMSRSKHESPYANSGIVMTLDPAALDASFGNDALSCMRYQEMIEAKAFDITGKNYYSPIQWAYDFMDQRKSRDLPPSSYLRGVRSTNLWDFMPLDVCQILRRGLEQMDRQWRGSFLRDATLVGPESRGSSPVRIPRDPQNRESTGIAGLYPIGEGAGFAGGIVSAAVDGLRTARVIIQRFAPFRS